MLQVRERLIHWISRMDIYLGVGHAHLQPVINGKSAAGPLARLDLE